MTSFVSKIFAKRVTKPDKPNSARSFIGYSGGTLINEDTAMKVAAFNRGVIYISTQIAKLPWEVKDGENNILYNDPIYSLLELAPNPEMNTFWFRIYMTIQAIVKGNAYAEIERDYYGRVKYLWPLKTGNVFPDRDESGNFIYRIVGGGTNGETTYLYPEDMFHIKNFQTRDGLTGDGVVAYAMETLGISAGGDRWANSMFANSGMPSGVLTFPNSLTDESAQRLKASWKENYGGRKVGGTAIIEEGGKFEPISLAPELLQFLESRKFGVIEIARFLGLPPTKLYATEAANYDNVENSNMEAATDTLDAWAKNFEMEADVKLLKKRFNGKKTQMDLYAVFRGDAEARANYFGKMFGVASISSDEIRRAEGRAPTKGGDRFYIASNNYSPVDRIDEIVDAQIKSKEPVKPVANDTEEENKRVQKKVARAISNYLEKKALKQE